MVKAIILSSLALVAGMAAARQRTPTDKLFDFFPHPAPAEELAIYDLRHDSAEGRMVATALQGVLNQDAARIYVLARPTDEPQLALLGRPTRLMPESGGSDPGLMAMARDHLSEIRFVAIWDEREDFTWNLALMKAALNHGAALNAKIAQRFREELGYTGEMEDLRGRFKDREAAYDWAVATLLPALDKTMLFSLGLRSDWKAAPWLAYDYALASRSFIFWLDERISAERRLIQKICAAGRYPAGTALMGYGAAGDDLLAAVNPYGIGFIVGDYYANGSVWASYPRHAYQQEPGEARIAEPGKIYVSITLSDGDNAQFAQGALFDAWRLDPARGRIPVGTTFAPAFQELASPIMDWFYAHRSSADELVAGPSGWQFIYLRNYAPDGLSRWLEFNRAWLAEGGMHTVHLWNGDWYSPSYRTYIAQSHVAGIFDGERDQGIWVEGDTTVINQGEHLWQEGDLYRTLAAVKPAASEPLFRALYPITGAYGYDTAGHPVAFSRIERELARLERDFPGRFVVLLPKDLIASVKLYRENHEGAARIAIRTDGSGEELPYLEHDSRSAIDRDHRFADGSAFFIYRFALPAGSRQAIARLDLGGGYQVAGSRDGIRFTTLASALNPAQRALVTVDLGPLLENNPDAVIFLRFADTTPANGMGASLWRIAIENP